MLITDPNTQDDRPSPERNGGKPSRPVVTGLTLLFLAVLILRNDFWNWETHHPLLFDCIPVGLWWQGMVSILAALMMWLMVRLAWPHELERLAKRHDSTEAEKKS
jgi:hypothetical protein